MSFTKKEIEFAKELANYEDKWVAIKRSRTRETIVASGDRITDAKAAADEIGEKDVTYMRVPSLKKILIVPLLRLR